MDCGRCSCCSNVVWLSKLEGVHVHVANHFALYIKDNFGRLESKRPKLFLM